MCAVHYSRIIDTASLYICVSRYLCISICVSLSLCISLYLSLLLILCSCNYIRKTDARRRHSEGPAEEGLLPIASLAFSLPSLFSSSSSPSSSTSIFNLCPDLQKHISLNLISTFKMVKAGTLLIMIDEGPWVSTFAHLGGLFCPIMTLSRPSKDKDKNPDRPPGITLLTNG